MISHATSLRLLVSLTLVMGLSGRPAAAQEAGGDGGGGAEVERFVAGMHNGLEQLAEASGGLTDAQKAKVAALEKSFADRVRKDPSLLKQGQALKGEVMAQFREILDPPQRKRFDEAMGEGQKRMASVAAGTKLKQVGLATLQYAQGAAGGAMPPDLGTLVAQGVIGADVLSLKPLPPDVAKKDAKALAAWANENGDFVYLAAGKASAALPPSFVVAHEKPGVNPMGANLLQADGSVQMVEGEKAKAVLAELKAGKNPPPSMK